VVKRKTQLSSRGDGSHFSEKSRPLSPQGVGFTGQKEGLEEEGEKKKRQAGGERRNSGGEGGVLNRDRNISLLRGITEKSRGGPELRGEE